MAFDPERMRQQQAARAQKELTRAKYKKLRTLLAFLLGGIVLAGVLVAAGFGIKHLISRSAKPPAPPTPADLTVIHLAAGGDLNVTPKIVGPGGDYTDTFLDVAALFANADIATLNFEGGLYGEPYGEDASAPSALPQALKNAGVDLVQLANSYTIYRGTAGLASTHSGMQAVGLTPVGAWPTAAAAKEAGGYTIKEVKGIKIAFVSFTKGMDGMALPPGSEGCVNLLYTDYASSYQEVDTEGITQILERVEEEEKPDLIVALLHWGSEFNDTVSTSQTKIVELMQENGVDAIIGTHSHYVQKMTFDPATGNFVAYSLGDFLGDADRAGTEYSVILDLEITKNKTTGETKITNYSYTPIFTVTDGNAPKVMRIDTAIAAYENNFISRVSASTYQAMKYALERIAARITAK